VPARTAARAPDAGATLALGPAAVLAAAPDGPPTEALPATLLAARAVVVDLTDPGGPIPPATLGLVAVLELAVDGVGEAIPSPGAVPLALTVEVRVPAASRVAAEVVPGATDARGRVVVEAARGALVVLVEERVDTRRAAAVEPALVAAALGRAEAELGVALVLAAEAAVGAPAVRAAASRAAADEAGVLDVPPATLFRGEGATDDLGAELTPVPAPVRLVEDVDADVGVGRVVVFMLVAPAKGFRVGMKPRVGFTVGAEALGAGVTFGVPAAISYCGHMEVRLPGEDERSRANDTKQGGQVRAGSWEGPKHPDRRGGAA
jgi:hypothetical protein